MIGAAVTIRDTTHRVLGAARRGSITSLSHAAGTLRKIARRSIRQRKKAAPVGQPPHTRRGQLRRSILYDVDRPATSAVVGPSYNLIGRVGAAHEFGLEERTVGGGRKPNWKIELGGHGPLAKSSGRKRLGRTRVAFIRIRTPRQLAAVRETVAGLTSDIRLSALRPRVRRYPRRPFMAPALEKLRPRLAPFWRASVKK